MRYLLIILLLGTSLSNAQEFNFSSEKVDSGYFHFMYDILFEFNEPTLKLKLS